MPGGPGAGLQAAPPKPRIQLPSIQAIFGLSRNDSLEQLSPPHTAPRPPSPAPSNASSQRSRASGASADLRTFSLSRHHSYDESAAASRQVPFPAGLVGAASPRPAAPPRSSSLRSSSSREEPDAWRRPRTPELFRAALDDGESSDGHSSMDHSSAHGPASPFGQSAPVASTSTHRATSYASSVRSADTYFSRHSQASTAASSMHSVQSGKAHDDLPLRPPFGPLAHPSSHQADLDRARFDLRLAGPPTMEYRSRSVPQAPGYWPQPPSLPPSHPAQAMMAPPLIAPPPLGRRATVPSPSHSLGGPWTHQAPPSAYTHPQAAAFYSPPLPTSPYSPAASPMSPSDSTTSAGDSDLPRYACTQCPKRFSRPSSLRIHQYSHSGERPFVCEECGRGFSVQSNLRRHGRVHQPKSGVPPSPAASTVTIVEEDDYDEDEDAMQVG